MAPEIIAGTEYTKSVDWWAFGIFIYEMVTGLPPFLNENRCSLYNSIQRLFYFSHKIDDAPSIPGYLSKDLQDLLQV